MRIPILLLILSTFLPAFADELPLTKGGPTEPPQFPTKGHRAPSAPIMCDIDWEAETVTIFGYPTEDIQSYEIWDENVETCLYSTDEQSEFFALAKSINSPTVIVFVFEDFTLFGCIEK